MLCGGHTDNLHLTHWDWIANSKLLQLRQFYTLTNLNFSCSCILILPLFMLLILHIIFGAVYFAPSIEFVIVDTITKMAAEGLCIRNIYSKISFFPPKYQQFTLHCLIWPTVFNFSFISYKCIRMFIHKLAM